MKVGQNNPEQLYKVMFQIRYAELTVQFYANDDEKFSTHMSITSNRIATVHTKLTQKK